MAKSNTIMIDYTIKVQEKEFSYREYFIPYSNTELAENNGSLFFTKKIDLELDRLFEYGVEYINEESILPETPNIILDMIYSLAHIPFVFQCNYDYFFCPVKENLKYIGIYTELLKQDIYRLKQDLSFLTNTYFFNSTDANLNKKLSKFKEKYQLEYEINYQNKESIRETLYYLCGFKNIDSKKSSIRYEIDLTKTDRLISLLKKYKEKDFIKKFGCFCLVRADSEWYFSISGTNPKYDDFGKKLEYDITQYFKHEKFNYCRLTDNVLSYGDKIINKKLNLYETPLSYSQAKNKFKEKISSEFSCCERKIFPIIVSSKSEYIICKYDPCPRCVPAVIKEKECKKDFLFKSFAHDVNDFAKYLNKEKTKLIHKLQLGTVNDIN